MSPRIAPLVLFDLDGTLLDTAPDLAAAVNRVLADLGRPAVPESLLRPRVSKGGRALLATALPDLDEAARDALIPPFLAHYAADIASGTRPYPGMEAALARIDRAGSRWGIVTNKPEGLARALVARIGWSARCAVLVGGDTLPVRKPDPAPLLHAARLAGAAPGDCVYVGDDARDVLAARAAGMPSVAALWGYRDADEDPVLWQADRYAQDPFALDDALLAAAVPA
ncbi:phosphoglycolate phosphatase [Coralloluteibacterium thermophilus]|uniref:Phosphoglycolate phosphatase n=1 Tax=Coralloluteibacterium thermophilum TaxID=2707049 RepID=A0ABV9NP06_9GAMM